MPHSEKEKPVFSKKIEKKVHAAKVGRAIPKPSLYLYNLRHLIPPIRRFPAPKDIHYPLRRQSDITVYLPPRPLAFKNENPLVLRATGHINSRTSPDDFESTLLLLGVFHLSTTVTGCAMVPGGSEACGLAAGLVMVGLGSRLEFRGIGGIGLNNFNELSLQWFYLPC